MLAKTALLLLATLALAPGQDRPRAFVREGDVRTRSFELMSDLELFDLEVVRNGASADAPADLALRHTEVLTIRVQDRFNTVREGVVVQLERQFEQANLSVASTSRGSLTPEDGGAPRLLASPLEGSTVLFERGADEALVARWAEDEDRPTRGLEGLAGDMDFAALLGDGSADEWALAPALFARLHEPAGQLALGSELDAARVLPVDTWAGTFIARAKADEPAEDEERARASLELTFEIVRTTDRTAELQASVESREGLSLEVLSATSTTTYRGEGACVWNSELGRLETLQLDAVVELLDEKDFRFDDGLAPVVQEQTQRLRGTSKLRYSIE